MSRLKQLIGEAHRRSLWQVVAIYLAASWVVFEVVQTVTEGLGLPEWFPAFAALLLLIGLPIVLATAFVQEGISPARRVDPTLMPGADVELVELHDTPAEAAGARRLFTWRNAIMGGMAAFALWGVVATVWFLFAGPGFLLKAEAADFFGAREKVVVAQFENGTDQEALGLAVREAIITDLDQSEHVNAVGRTEMIEVLGRMRVADTTVVDEQVALEIARREGHPAVVAGAVSPLGSGFQLSARIIEVATGEVAVRVRETAADGSEVVPAVERLSRLVRRHLGESLASVRRSQPLPAVTTASLEALEFYARGVEYGNRGDGESAIPLLEQAVALDTAFATAYRALSIYHGNLGNLAAGQRYVGRAYAHFDRLAMRERYLVGALYHIYLYRVDSTIYYYELETERDPDSYVAINNLGDLYERIGRYEEAFPLYRRAHELIPERPTPYNNLASISRTLGDHATADSMVAHLQAEFPGTFGALAQAVSNRLYAGDFDAAVVAAAELAANPSPTFSAWGHWYLSSLAASRGDMGAVLAHTDSAIALGVESGGTLVSYLALENLQNALVAAGAPELARPYLEKVEPVAFGETTAFTGHWGLAFIAEGHALIGDTANAQRFIEQLDSIAQTTGFLPTGLESHVRAILALQAGKTDEGIAHLEQARADNYGRMRRKSRLLLADAEAAEGRLEVAAAHYDSLTSSYRLNFTEQGLYGAQLPLAHERAASAFLELGDTTAALKHLAAFVELWQNADPELQPRVEAARRTIVTLSPDQ